MPDLNKLPVPEYAPGNPYHFEYDNIPLKTLAERDNLINGQVNMHAEILMNAAGDQGTLSARLNQSIDQSGNLLTSAVNEALHNIAEHEDGQKTVDANELNYYINLGFPSLTNPVNFVRMLESERDKLAGIADEATNFAVSVVANQNTVLYEDGVLEIVESETIKWEQVSENKVAPVLGFTVEFAHKPYYNQIPNSIPTIDNINYKKFSVSPYPFVEGSLRVYINGLRMTESTEEDKNLVYHPTVNPLAPWKLNTFVPDHINGEFELDVPITAIDSIVVDFDIQV